MAVFHSTTRRNDEREFSAVHLNVRSIRSFDKFDRVVSLLCPRFDVVIFSETWLRQEESVFYNVEGYERVACCRDTRGGGLMMFIKKETRIKSVHRGPLSSAESVSVELECSIGSLTVTAVYRPPTYPVKDFVEELDTYLGHHHHHILLGDLNIHFTNTQDALLLGPILEANGHRSLINVPTRFSPSRTLDHIFSNVPTISSDILDVGVSDHLAVWCLLSMRMQPVEPRLYNRTNIPALRARLEAEPWTNFYLATNVDTKYDTFLRTLKEHITNTTTTCQRSDQDFRSSSELQHLKRKRNQLWRKYLRSKKHNPDSSTTVRLLEDYRRARNRLQNRETKLRRKAVWKKTFELCRSGAAVWKLIRKMKRDDKAPPISKIVTSQETAEVPQAIGELLNNYFLTSLPAVPRQITAGDAEFRQFLGSQCNPAFEFRTVSQLEVLSLLGAIGQPAAGHDGLQAYIIHKMRDLLCAPLTHLINQIIIQAEYPRQLKTARVVPIHKSGVATDPGNYRPISVLPVINKVVEKALVKQMEAYLETNKLLSASQFGFRKRHGTGHAILQLIEEIRFELDKGRYCAAILLDFKRAFDSVNPGILLEKLSHLGFRSSACKLLASYFSDRWQFVDIGGTHSTLLPVERGVPQGSCIGPLAFLCYINDLANAVTSKCIMYADDCTLRFIGSSPAKVESQMETDMSSVFDWCAANTISVNARKTQVIVFKASRANAYHPSVNIGGIHAPVAANVKLLGMHIDDRLDGSAHTRELIARIAKTTFAVRYIKNHLGPTSCLFLYNAFVLPHLFHGAELWTGASGIWLNRLNVAQGRFLRMFRGSAARERAEHGIMDIFKLSIFLMLLIVFKSLRGLGPSILNLNLLGDLRSTRATGASVLKIRAHKRHICSKAFGARATKEWNLLPKELRTETSYNRFKAKLKAHLLS